MANDEIIIQRNNGEKILSFVSETTARRNW